MVKVTLKSDAQNLDEVIVVAYGTAKKSSFTGSAAVIKADKIVSGSKESFDKALSGKMAGVRTASATGDPGSMAHMLIGNVRQYRILTMTLSNQSILPFMRLQRS